ncbi:MAG: carboxylate--amine ligase [Elusimicrobiota bacterium]
MKAPLYVALSGINATDNPGPGVPVARSLRESGLNVRLIGLSYDVNDPGNYMDFLFETSYRLPFPAKGWPAILESLKRIKGERGLDIIIPSLDAELPLYIRHARDLAKLNIKTFLPTPGQFEIRNKDRLGEICKSFGALYPETAIVNSIGELAACLGQGGRFPCVIKGKYYKAYIVNNIDDAARRFTEIADEWGAPILVQKIIYGKEINLIGLGDGKGGSCGMVAIKKMTTTAIGKIWTGVTIAHPGLLRLAELFVKKTSWRGPFELECIESGGELYVIEVNPRFPAWVYFSTAAGINLPERLINLVTKGKCDRSCDYKAGRLFVRYTYEIVTGLEEYSRLALQ